MDRTRKIIFNFGFLTAGKTFGDLFLFLLFIVLSRTFGKDGIGQYSFAIGLTGFFAVVADFGLFPFTIKEISQNAISFTTYYGRIFSLRVGLSATVFALLLLAGPFLPFPYDTKVVIVIIGAYQLLSRLVEGIGAAFVAHEDMHLAALLEGSQKAIAASLGSIVVFGGGSLVSALISLLVVTALHLLLGFGLMVQKYGCPKFVMSFSSLFTTARHAFPYALSLLFFQVYSRADVVLLGFFLGTAAAGIYNVAYRVVFVLMMVPHFAAFAIFPLASKLYINSPQKFRDLYNISLNSLILIAVPAGAGLWLIAPNLIRLVFSETFIESIPILRLLASLLFLAFLNRTMGVFLMSSDRQLKRTKCQWFAALVNLVGNLVLIPIIGIKGAAISALFTETLLVALYAYNLRRILGFPEIWSRLAVGTVATVSFVVPLAFFESLSLFIAVPLAIIIYVTVLSFFKDIRQKEFRTAVRIYKRHEDLDFVLG